MMFQKALIFGLFITVSLCDPYDAPQTLTDRQTMVHLFEWKWTDIANECETFLAKYKYGAVQISPPNEHLMQDYDVPGHGIDQPWWIRYQPVSYKFQSRGGTQEELMDMINRCNKVGVRIYVDAVINHMTKVDEMYPGQYGIYTSGDSTFNGKDGIESYPGVPYSNLDFHDPECHRDIQQSDYYDDAWAVRTCRLADCDTCPGLLDLDHSKDYVRQKISEYMNNAIDMGVAGFRVDAVKHIYPDDILAIVDMTKNINASLYGASQRPFVVQEVIDTDGTEAVKEGEYVNSGRVTNFKYGLKLAAAVNKQDNFKYFYNFGPAWSMMQDISTLVFVDNHDNQRSGAAVITYKTKPQYIMAVTYMLAWSYGYPRVMSSYYFDQHDQGPPSDGYPWTVRTPQFNDDETCVPEVGWVCEHRWPEIRRMVVFRSVVKTTWPANVITEDNRIAFRRGDQGFFALNNANSDWERSFYLGLPAGTYCDVISGEYSEDTKTCTGIAVIVESSGYANVKVQAGTTLGIHIGERIPTTPIPPPTPLPPTFQRTAVLIHMETQPGQNLFIRGGLDQDTHGCKGDQSAQTSQCSLPIQHQTQVADEVYTYLGWSQEDAYLDWFGGEVNQGTYDGILALGTPLTWTTNDPTNIYYNPLNIYGENYWLVDTMMDCSRTDNGWFSVKGFFKDQLAVDKGIWEQDITQTGQCKGNAGVGPTPTNIGPNHAAMCGKINVFHYEQNDCEINVFDSDNMCKTGNETRCRWNKKQ